MQVSRRAALLGAAAVPLAAAAPAATDAITCPLAAAPTALVPGVATRPAERFIGSLLYRGLVRFDAAGPQPDLAAAWEVSADGLRYTFHLRPGVTWHDSGGVTAADVVFSLARFHPAVQPDGALGRIRGVAAEDGQTVTLTLATPFPPLLRLLDASRAAIVPRHVHDRPGWALDPRAVTPVGAGPFRVADWLRLIRFDWFAGPKPALGEIAFPILPDPAARLAAMDPGPALLMADALPLGAVPGLRQLPGLAVEGDVAPTEACLAGVRLNGAAPPLDDPRVRQALACVVDRAAVLRQAWLGLGRPATGPTVTGSQDRNPAATLPPFDPRAAAALLTAAGLRPDESGIRLRLSHLVPPDAPWPALAAVLRAALGRVGIDLVLEPVDAAECARRVAAGAFQTVGFSAVQLGDPLVDLAGYTAELPELAPLLNQEWDLSTRAAAIAKAQALLADATVRLWLAEPAEPFVRSKRLHLPEGLHGRFETAFLA